MTEAELLERIADAIFAGREIDWESARRSASPITRELLGELQIVAGIAELSRAADPPATPAQTVQPVDSTLHWGSLRLIEAVGEGASATVYRAWDTRLDREVALKLFRGDLAQPAAMLDEGRMLAKLRHPGIVTVYGAEEYGGRPGVWMEFIRGETLEAFLERRDPLPIEDAVTIASSICDALQAVHDAGLLHRDLKPHNIMRESGGRIVLMDFHVSNRSGEPQQGGGLVGTPLYLAPEILLDRQPASAQSDLYSVAVIAYRLLTRRYPMNAETLDALKQALHDGVITPIAAIRPDVPATLARIIEGGLSRYPSGRPQSARATAAAMRRAAERRGLKRPSHRWWLTAAALVLVCTATLTFASRRQRERPGEIVIQRLDWSGFRPNSQPTPDGRLIGGTTGPGMLAPGIRDLATGEVRDLEPAADEGHRNTSIAISPDDRRAAYNWMIDNNHSEDYTVQIKVVDLASGSGRILTTLPEFHRARIAQWSPDERWLLMTTDDDRGNHTISRVDADTGVVRTLFTMAGEPPLGLSISPDATTIAFDTARPAQAGAHDIWLLDVATAKTTPLVTGPGNDLYPFWLSDGRTIAFESDRSGSLALWSIDRGARGDPNAMRLVKDGLSRFAPLGFTAAGELYYTLTDATTDLYRLPFTEPLDAKLVPVLDAFVGQNNDGEWSPDDQSIAFCSARTDIPSPRRGTSLVIRSLSSGEERRVVPDYDAIEQPRWAPDGRTVLFIGAIQDIARKLSLLSVADGSLGTLPVKETWWGDIQWSTDGRAFYGTAWRAGGWGIRRHDIATGNDTELAWPTNMHFVVSHDEQWLAQKGSEEGSPAAVHTWISLRAASGGEWQKSFEGGQGDQLELVGWTNDDRDLLVLRSYARDLPQELWAIPTLDGIAGRPRLLRKFPDMGVSQLRLSHDGRDLLLTVWRQGPAVWAMRGFEF